MTFESHNYHVLISSPSDLSADVEIVERAIYAWTALNSVAEQVVALPVRWGTHTYPATGMRPQQAINDQIVEPCDILIAMFWTRLGTDTGVAASGTVEEINEFVAAGKPVMIYFSDRPAQLSMVDLEQSKRLAEFRESLTGTKALVGSFSSDDGLRDAIKDALTRQIRLLESRRRQGIERDQIRELQSWAQQSEAMVERARAAMASDIRMLLSREDAKAPQRSAEESKGPNGYRVGYLPDGSKVEWIPSDEEPGEEWPMVLRRGDPQIVAAYNEFWDKVWWNRHQNWLYRLKSGEETLTEERKAILETAKKAARRIERKYGGKKKLGWNDFEWGLLSGKMSALAWVLGSEWEESLDT
jgi:nucleoside 2-deoxyribosyltransferase